jgi:hypothetical protein
MDESEEAEYDPVPGIADDDAYCEEMKAEPVPKGADDDDAGEYG